MGIAAGGVLDLIPQLVRGFCESTVDDERDKIATGSMPPSDFPSPYHMPSTEHCNSIDHMDTEFEIITRACDQTIHAVAQYVENLRAALRMRRNQLLPVYRLPHETLAMIFEHAEASTSNKLRPLSRKAPLNVSRVSRSWRNVALNTPKLWATLDSTNSRLAHVFLHRSRDAPLSIDLTPCDEDDYYYSDDEDSEEPHLRLPVPRDISKAAYEAQIAKFPEFLQPLLPHIPRWRNLNLGGIPPDHLDRFLYSPAPKLESLCIKGLPNNEERPTTEITLFGERTPSIRDLELHYIAPPLTSSIYNNLKRLHLNNITDESGTKRQFLNVLVACPGLEDLALRFVSFERPNSADPHIVPGTVPFASISLPHLQRVILLLRSAGHHMLRDILSAIVAPPTLELQVARSSPDFPFHTLFPSAPNIEQSLPNLVSLNWLFFTLPFPKDSVLRILGGNFQDQGGLDLYTRYRASELHKVAETISGLGQHLPPFSLRSLSFNGIHETALSQAAFIHFISEWGSEITSLTFSGGSSWLFVESLVVDPTSNQPLVPQLQELRLQNVNIDRATWLKLAKSRMGTPVMDASALDTTTSSFEPFVVPAPVPAPAPARFRRFEISDCTGVDLATVRALRDLSVEVHLLKSGSKLEDMEYSRFGSL